jgi:hypothetical protein
MARGVTQCKNRSWKAAAMTEDNSRRRSLAPRFHWVTWTGPALIIASLIIGGVLRITSVRLFSSVTIQLALVLSSVIGSTLTIAGLQRIGRISKDVLDGTTLILAVAAIVFAMWQFRDSRIQEARMEALSKQASTRFAGFFPKNLKDINQVLADADRSLDIMSDFVGYGHYSAPDEFDRYLWKLEDLSSHRRLPIRMLIYTLEKGRQIHNAQFTESDFRKAKDSNDERLIAFCGRFNNRQVPNSKQDFDDLLFRKQRDYIKALDALGVQIRVTKEDLPFYFWDEDDNDAVISFLDVDSESSLRTRDTSLILDTFKVRFCRLWNKADDLELTPTAWRPTRRADHDAMSNCKVR